MRIEGENCEPTLDPHFFDGLFDVHTSVSVELSQSMPIHLDAAAIVRVASRAEWRQWLAVNHATRPEAWLWLPNAALRRTLSAALAYDDAVEEALCFGWIDTTVKKLEIEPDARFQRFTKRRAKGSNWSELNKQRVRMLDAASLMTAAGWEAIPEDVTREIRNGSLSKAPELPADVQMALNAAPGGVKAFRALPPGYQRIKIDYVNMRVSGLNSEEAERSRRIALLVKQALAGKVVGGQTIEFMRREAARKTDKVSTNASKPARRTTVCAAAKKETTTVGRRKPLVGGGSTLRGGKVAARRRRAASAS